MTAIEHAPWLDRVASLVLVATSGGVDVARFGAADWRPEYVASLPGLPKWFVDDQTDFTERLAEIRARTLLLWSDADPVSPLSIAKYLAERIPRARLAIVRGGAHAFAQERADEVASLIRSHLE